MQSFPQDLSVHFPPQQNAWATPEHGSSTERGIWERAQAEGKQELPRRQDPSRVSHQADGGLTGPFRLQTCPVTAPPQLRSATGKLSCTSQGT